MMAAASKKDRFKVGDAVWHKSIAERSRVGGVVELLFPEHRKARYGVKLDDGRFVHSTETDLAPRRSSAKQKRKSNPERDPSRGAITSEGVVAPKKVKLQAKRQYPMGASSSPDLVYITKLTADRVYYRKWPYVEPKSKELVIERWIAEDLVHKGITNWLETGYPAHQPTNAKRWRAVLGGKSISETKLSAIVPEEYRPKKKSGPSGEKKARGLSRSLSRARKFIATGMRQKTVGRAQKSYSNAWAILGPLRGSRMSPGETAEFRTAMRELEGLSKHTASLMGVSL